MCRSVVRSRCRLYGASRREVLDVCFGLSATRRSTHSCCRREILAGCTIKLDEADERKMPKRRHGAPFDDAHASVARHPLREALPAEFRPPAKPARERRKPAFESGAKAGLCAEMIDQNDFAAWPQDTREFVKRGFRVGDRGDNILSDHYVEN